MNIATLGPEGTFSHEAAKQYSGNGTMLFQKTVWDVFEAVHCGQAELGVAPLENSVSGSIGSTLDALMRYHLKITGELILPVRHHLAGSGSLRGIKTIYVQPQTYEQCEKFIRKNLSNANVEMAFSNAAAAKALKRGKGNDTGAIVPQLSLDLYGLSAIMKNVQDHQYNATRFIVISKGSGLRSKEERTSISVSYKKDKPGLLYHLLGLFALGNINLTKIESRPAKGKLGQYIFFIDFQGHQLDPNVKGVLHAIGGEFRLTVFGSYPRVY